MTTNFKSMTAKNKIMNAKSRRIPPSSSGLIRERNHRMGGSVVRAMSETATSEIPRGRQERANDSVISSTMRMISKTCSKVSTI